MIDVDDVDKHDNSVCQEHVPKVGLRQAALHPEAALYIGKPY
jgi:hypothetical protein